MALKIQGFVSRFANKLFFCHNLYKNKSKGCKLQAVSSLNNKPLTMNGHTRESHRMSTISQIWWGSCDPGHIPFSKNFKGVPSGLKLGIYMPNVESAASTIPEILLLTPKNLGVTWPWHHPLFEKCLRGYARTVSGNMYAKFEVRSFNHSGVIII